MRYAQIRKYDVANGTGVRVSVFVTGCTHNCFNCFNKEYQNFGFGSVWTDRETDKTIECLKLPQISGRLSLIGGEPMQNARALTSIVREIKEQVDTNIWLWSGYTLEQILLDQNKVGLLREVDVLVDGLFIEEKKDLTLRFRGSSNQRVIDVKETLRQSKIILYME